MLKAAIKHHVGPRARLAVAWIVVPEGSWYAAGRLSTSSIAQVGVPDGFEPSARAALMRDINARWCAITGQDPKQLMVSAPDRTAARHLMMGMLAQVPIRQKPRVVAHHVLEIARSLVLAR